MARPILISTSLLWLALALGSARPNAGAAVRTAPNYTAQSASGQPLVEAGAVWRYLDDGSDQGTAWRAPAFDDSGWAAGPAQLGYGDGDEATVVDYGTDPGNKHITTYFRYSFNAADASLIGSLTLSLLRDDGAVVYLNGTEIYRSNLPAGSITFATPASATVGGSQESEFESAILPAEPLVDGANLLAVEIHQVHGASSDISFDLALSGGLAPAACAAPEARFAVIGDFGNGSQAEADVADLVHSWVPDFVLTTGDNNYPSGGADTIDAHIGRYYHAFIGDYTGSYGAGAAASAFFPALGNHDWDTNAGNPPTPWPYLDYFTLPGNERYYAVSWGPVDVFVVDSDAREPDGISANSAQAAWLQAALAASDAAWRLVTMHHPPYSSGVHGSSSTLQWPFGSWGASAVLAGHDHTYERLEVNGLTYIVNGLGGASRYGFGPALASSRVRYAQDHGAMLVEAGATCLHFRFITRAGILIDSHTLLNQSLFLPLVARL